MSGVPRMMAIKIFVAACTGRYLDRRSAITTIPSGSENSRVRKKIAQVRSIPAPMVDSIVDKLM